MFGNLSILRYLCALITTLLFLGMGGSLRSQVGPSGQVPVSLDPVHFGDLIDVDVVGSVEFDWRGRITPEGYLDGLDRIPSQIYALCRTEEEIAKTIAAEYGRFLRDPQVVVRILDRSSRPEVYLTGAVKSPHRFKILRSVRLNELLISTGGITDTSSGEITIFRPSGSTCESAATPEGGGGFSARKSPETLIVKISDLLKGLPEANPKIYSGDVIDVTPAWPVYVIGGVNNPLQLALRSELTVTRAVASAGGISKEGVADTVTIYRREDGRSQILEVDLPKVESGRSPDIELKAFDIIDVAQKGRGRRQFPPVVDVDSLRSVPNSQLPLRIID